MSPLKRMAIVFVIPFALFSCVKEEIKVNQVDYGIHPQFGVPIANVTIKADRLIENFDENGLVEVGENGSISLIYRDTLDPLSAAELLNIGDQDYGDTINLTSSQYEELTNNGSVTVVDEVMHSFISNDGDKLDSVRFESGTFNFNITSQGSFPLTGEIRIYNADNSEAFSFAFSDDSPPVDVNTQIDFENLLLLFINNSSISNGLRVEYEVTLTSDGSGSSAPVYLDVSLVDASIKRAGGYFAPRQIDFGEESIEIDLFKDPNVRNIRLEDPRINFNFENDFGLGLGIFVSSLTGLAENGETSTVSGDDIDQLPPISASQALGVPAFSTISITNDMMTPSITEFLEIAPSTLVGDFGLVVNPEELQNAFITNEDELKINFELEIPVYGSIKDFLLIDTTALDLGSLIQDTQDLSEVESLDILLIVDNGFPFDAGVQIVFADSLYNPIDSLFETPDLIYSSAPVNLSVAPENPDYGRATGKTRTITEIGIPKSKILGLENASQMIITVFGNSAGNGDHPIRLFSNDSFDAKLSAKATLNLDSDD